MPVRDERWLEKRRRLWYVKKEIPRDVRHAFIGPSGKPQTRLLQSLHTDNHTLALARRHKVLGEFEARFEAARGNKTHRDLVDAALTWRTHAMQQENVEDRLLAQADIEGSAADIEDPNQRETFLAIASGVQTPFESFLDTWLGEQDIEARSKSHHRYAVKELIAWADANKIPPTLESFDRRTAGRYVSHLLGQGIDRNKTVSKRLWSLSRLWAWLESKGYADANPWRGHEIGRNGRAAREKQKERPFTPKELNTLLNGTPTQPLPDMMRLALLSGATVEELALIRVQDVDVEERTISYTVDPKTPARRRVTPVHSAVWPMVQARLTGKSTDDFLFHELGPAPAEGMTRSKNIARNFGNYRLKQGVHEAVEGQRRSLVNFHSFRRTFITMAEQAGQPETTIRSVVGHKRQGMTSGVYSGGPSLEQRRACVEAVRVDHV